MKKIPFLNLQAQYKSIREEINEVIQKVLDTSEYILGPEVDKFEKEFANYIGTKYCIAVDSGTSALELGMRALKVEKNDEVITPVNSFIASSFAITVTDAKPIWIDCDEKTFNIDTTQLERKITKKTKAIMPVHLYGQPANMDDITSIARKYNLLVIEDACQAHGAKYKGKRVGSFGEFAAFSFYPGKNLGAYGDAGAITTNNKDVYEKLKMLRNYGQSKKYHHEILGWNRRMDSLQAGILQTKLMHLEKWNNKRRKKAKLYDSYLKDAPIITPFIQKDSEHAYHLYVIRAQKRNQLKSFLFNNGIETKIHYPVPIHLQNSYKNSNVLENFPASEKLAQEILSLPIYPELSDKDILYICSKIKEFYSK